MYAGCSTDLILHVQASVITRECQYLLVPGVVFKVLTRSIPIKKVGSNYNYVHYYH